MSDKDDSRGPDLCNARVRRILAAAKELFLSQSYAGTSTEDIARRAGVSKGTLYAHFSGKEDLFSCVIRRELAQIAKGATIAETTAGDIERSLYDIGRRFLDVFLTANAIDIYRAVVNEAPRFPQFGRQFYFEGPRHMVDALAAFLAEADRTGRLAVPDPEIAAIQFISLVRANLVLKSALKVELPTPERCEAIIEAAVQLFTRGYAAPPP